MIEVSGFRSIPLTRGSGSRKPKNIWILHIRLRNTGRNVDTLQYTMCPTLFYLELLLGSGEGECIPEVLLLNEVQVSLLQQSGLPLLRLILVKVAVRPC
jgi:hypothetical protein